VAHPETDNLTQERFAGELNGSQQSRVGGRVIRSAVRNRIRKAIGLSLAEELHHYGVAVRGWSGLAVKQVAAFLESHADAYRIQIQRIGGHSQNAQGVLAMERDLRRLREGMIESSSDVASRRA
jgi:hypothetical protein